MAKVYETHKDFERDVLDEQSRRLHAHAHAQNTTGWKLFAAGTVVDLWNMSRKTASRGLSVAGNVLLIGAIIEWIQSWRTGGKAHDIELQRERLGPETIALPPQEWHAQEKEACEPCKAKMNRAMRLRKSLTDFAERPDDGPGNVNR